MQSSLLRDQGIERVLQANCLWFDKAVVMFKMFVRPGEELTGEDIRARLLEKGLPAPASANAWGALIGKFVHSGALIDTGRIKRMKALRSHARRTPIWVVK